jgi:hypothetical protein
MCKSIAKLFSNSQTVKQPPVDFNGKGDYVYLVYKVDHIWSIFQKQKSQALNRET